MVKRLEGWNIGEKERWKDAKCGVEWHRRCGVCGGKGREEGGESELRG
jgi:hypothetical protein